MVTLEQSSFRDPAGRVFVEDGEYYREISQSYWPEYKKFMQSGLFDKLIDDGLLLPHVEKKGYIIKPEQLGFISYPYEWCFNSLKQAALTTLEINLTALDFGMILKDASAYNIQYHNGKWLLIDTLSFETYQEGKTWSAYGQFLRHFYLPLMLTVYRSPDFIRELSLHFDGIPVQSGIKLLPVKTIFNAGALLHLHTHRIKNLSSANGHKTSKQNIVMITRHLKHNITRMFCKADSAWTHYEEQTPYTKSKSNVVKTILKELSKSSLCDIGTNTGKLASAASSLGHKVVAIDRDHGCIEKLSWRDSDLLPLVIDLTNPTPAIGWANTERKSFLKRAKFDTVMALALIHHLCIGNNVPLFKVAEVLASMTKHSLIIEFMPPSDDKAQLIAKDRVFPQYDQTIFELAFSRYFKTVATHNMEDTKRIIYHMEKV